jgi:hypothetical protein
LIFFSQVNNSLDQAFFIVTEKEDIIGQINIPVTTLQGKALLFRFSRLFLKIGDDVIPFLYFSDAFCVLRFGVLTNGKQEDLNLETKH